MWFHREGCETGFQTHRKEEMQKKGLTFPLCGSKNTGFYNCQALCGCLPFCLVGEDMFCCVVAFLFSKSLYNIKLVADAMSQLSQRKITSSIWKQRLEMLLCFYKTAQVWNYHFTTVLLFSLANRQTLEEHLSEFLPLDAQVFRIPKTLNKSIGAVKSKI